jgi:NADPH-dependent ferric siderophore reductase
MIKNFNFYLLKWTRDKGIKMNIIDKLKSVKNKRATKELTVTSAFNLTPNMRRITLQGTALSSFPKDAEGAYIKLLFSQLGNIKPTLRTYTIAQQRYELNEIDVDFMLHNNSLDHGIAASWSRSVQVGEEISIAGPGSANFINSEAEYFFLAGDMTALPALAANLKRLPQNARGQVFIEILSEADQQNLIKPENIEIHWIVNNNPGADESPLFHIIKQAELPNVLPHGKLAAWVACEFKTMKKIRQYLKFELGVEKSHLYVSSYWKKGNTEEQHKVVKQQDAKQT